MREREPQAFQSLSPTSRASRAIQIEETYKARELEIVKTLARDNPLPKEPLQRIARVGSDASLARELALEELVGTFSPSPEPRSLPPGVRPSLT